MPTTNFDALLSALEPFTVQLNGEVFTAREISYLEGRRLQADMAAVADDDEQVVRRFCDTLELPTDRILALPDVLIEAMIRDFFAWRRTRQTTPHQPPSP